MAARIQVVKAKGGFVVVDRENGKPTPYGNRPLTMAHMLYKTQREAQAAADDIVLDAAAADFYFALHRMGGLPPADSLNAEMTVGNMVESLVAVGRRALPALRKG